MAGNNISGTGFWWINFAQASENILSLSIHLGIFFFGKNVNISLQKVATVTVTTKANVFTAWSTPSLSNI